MQFQPTLIPYLGVAVVLALVLLWFIERDRRRMARSFRSSSELLALGLPALPPSKGGGSGDRGRVISEFRQIGEEYKLHYRAIASARSDFFLSNEIRISDVGGGSRSIAHPSRLLTCDVILGDSLASADLTPGTAIYWLRISGRKIGEAVNADPTFAADLSRGDLRTIIIGDFRIEMYFDGARLCDLRPDGIGEVHLERGTPMVLSLDEESEKGMQEAFGDDAPVKGMSRKVRLFGGFQIDETGYGLDVIPYRQQPGMSTAVEGRLHPLSSLLGIVVAEARDKAFAWKSPKLEPDRPSIVEAFPAPHALAALHTSL